jgi:hypothetical protein
LLRSFWQGGHYNMFIKYGFYDDNYCNQASAPRGRNNMRASDIDTGEHLTDYYSRHNA